MPCSIWMPPCASGPVLTVRSPMRTGLAWARAMRGRAPAAMAAPPARNIRRSRVTDIGISFRALRGLRPGFPGAPRILCECPVRPDRRLPDRYRPYSCERSARADRPSSDRGRSGARNNRPDAEKGPAARPRPRAAREAYSLYVERAVAGANESNGPFSASGRCLDRDEAIADHGRSRRLTPKEDVMTVTQS